MNDAPEKPSPMNLGCPCGRTTFDLRDRAPGEELHCPACDRVSVVPDPAASTADMEAPRPPRRSQMTRRERVALDGSVLDMNEEQFAQYAARKPPLLVTWLRIYRRLGVKGLVILWHVLLLVGTMIFVAWRIAQGAEVEPDWGMLILVVLLAAFVGVAAFVLHTFLRHKMMQRAAAAGGGRTSSRRTAASARRSSRASASSARRAAVKRPADEGAGGEEEQPPA